jgi:hypothetical protein
MKRSVDHGRQGRQKRGKIKVRNRSPKSKKSKTKTKLTSGQKAHCYRDGTISRQLATGAQKQATAVICITDWQDFRPVIRPHGTQRPGYPFVKRVRRRIFDKIDAYIGHFIDQPMGGIVLLDYGLPPFDFDLPHAPPGRPDHWLNKKMVTQVWRFLSGAGLASGTGGKKFDRVSTSVISKRRSRAGHDVAIGNW